MIRMKEALFRGKNATRGWVTGYYVRHETRQLCPLGSDALAPDEVIHYIAQDTFADWGMARSIELVSVDPESVGQFTGLKDKKGNDICEGDILRFEDRLCRVLWHSISGAWDCRFIRFNGEHYDCEFAVRDMGRPSKWKYYAEVVGNVFDNPELVKEEPIV